MGLSLVIATSPNVGWVSTCEVCCAFAAYIKPGERYTLLLDLITSCFGDENEQGSRGSLITIHPVLTITDASSWDGTVTAIEAEGLPAKLLETSLGSSGQWGIP